MGTDSDKGVIDDVGRAFNIKWEEENLINIKELRAKRKEAKDNKVLCNELDQQINDAKIQNAIKAETSPYSLAKIAKIKKEYDNNPEETKRKYPEIFYYFDGLLNVKVSQSIHPAGIVASPITLPDHYGTFISDGKTVLQLDMEDVHESGLVKYDILG